jgi:hypothetical protein
MIDERDSDFGMEAAVQKIVISFAFVIAGSVLISLPSVFQIEIFGQQLVFSVVVLLLFGLPFAPCTLSSWKKARLQICDNELSISARATPETISLAEAIIIRYGDEPHVPLTTAVPVTGDIEILAGGTFLPLRLATVVP